MYTSTHQIDVKTREVRPYLCLKIMSWKISARHAKNFAGSKQTKLIVGEVHTHIFLWLLGLIYSSEVNTHSHRGKSVTSKHIT